MRRSIRGRRRASHKLMTKGERAFSGVLLWSMAVLVPLAFIPGSHNPVLVKLPAFSVPAGLLLAFAGFRFIRDPRRVPFHVIPVALLGILTALTLYRPTVQGITRVTLVASGAAVFISAGVMPLKPRRILLPAVWGSVIALAALLLVPSSSHRLSGTFGNPNLAASYAACMLLPGLALLEGKGLPGRLFQILLLLLCAWVIYRSGTRAPLAAIPGGLLAYLLIMRKRLLTLTLLFLLVVSLTLLHSKVEFPVLTGSAGVRQTLWEGAGDMFLEKPLTGHGTGSFHMVFQGFRPAEYGRRGMPPGALHAHSEPLELLAENGLVGFLLWLVLVYLLLRSSPGRGKATPLERGALAAFIVLLVEGLFSVALRWTSTFFLFSLLAAALQGPEGEWRLTVPRFTGVLFTLCGVALIGLSVLTLPGMLRSILLYDRATAGGVSRDEAIDLCLRSTAEDPWNSEAWFYLGNLHVAEGLASEDPSKVERAVSLYDSLALRFPDYQMLPVNRAVAFISLGMWDEALGDVTRIYRSHYHLKRTAVDSGTEMAPLAGHGARLRFACLIYTGVLTSQNAPVARRALGTTFALAAVHTPEEIPGMLIAVDSILTLASYQGSGEILAALEAEVSLAQEGFLLAEEAGRGMNPEAEEMCLRAMEVPGVFAPYHRYALTVHSSEGGGGGHYPLAKGLALLYHDSCYFLGDIFPGSEDIFLMAASISSAGDGRAIMGYFRRMIELEGYRTRVMRMANTALESRRPDPSRFQVSTGGDTAEFLELVSGEPPETRLRALFMAGVLAHFAPGANREVFPGALEGPMALLIRDFLDMYGADGALRVIPGILNEEQARLENGPFGPEVAGWGRAVREVIQGHF